MASAQNGSTNGLHCLCECSVCQKICSEPRILSCFHVACLKCFEEIQSRTSKKPGDALPCPLCRQDFSIPSEGMAGLRRSFFLENLIEVTKTVNVENKPVPCDACSIIEEASEANKAATRCLTCAESYCIRCSKIHSSQKFTKDHKIVEFKSEIDEDQIKNMFPIRKCKAHSDKVLEYYCRDCKTVVCIICYVRDHKTHDCNDVAIVDKDFRQKLGESSTKLHGYKEQILSKKLDMERQKREFLGKALETETAIRRKSQQLKDLIEQHTQDILNEFSQLKQKHQQKIESKIEEIERKVAVLDSFVAYCAELKSKGSPCDVCCDADNLIKRAKQVSNESEDYLKKPSKSVEVKFTATNQDVFLQNSSNAIGKLSESKIKVERHAVIVGLDRRHMFSITNEVVRINLNRPKDVSSLPSISTQMQWGAAVAVNRSSIFVTGIGDRCDEIWRYGGTSSSKWKKCSSLVQGRQGHSIAFVDHVLYFCGGFMHTFKTPFDDVEAYDTAVDKCSSVGKLINAIRYSGNCVPFKTSLYIFGGCNAAHKAVSDVQVYDTKSNTCALLSKPLPTPCERVRGVLCENTVILLGSSVCYLYNVESETWSTRDKFKPGVEYFGMVVNDGKIFVIGDSEPVKKHVQHVDVKWIPVANFLNDEPIKWKRHARIPRSSSIYVFGIIDNFL